ncbi:MAG TPA: alpha/beta hydrolase [Flavobacteriia bacterium]|jgi:pimeloyl-ACP methyl ester carboxylesterase|nr:alpha/beta hydrolase [Flavobacteriia bacterium]
MSGFIIDTARLQTRLLWKRFPKNWAADINMVTTDYGKLRVKDTGGNKPVIISVPDGPNVIEHHEELIAKLAKNYRVVCFELPGFGFSYPQKSYDYSFELTAKIIINLMDVLQVKRASLSFSCANGFYGITVARMIPERIEHLFLAQTPAMHQMQEWAKRSIPKPLKTPWIGQVANAFLEKKLARIWYQYALPKDMDTSDFQQKALANIKSGGCFCLSSLVQGLAKEMKTPFKDVEIPTTLVWGNKDFTHRNTNFNSIKEHLPTCKIVEFDNCGHFPDLENTTKYAGLINETLAPS